MFPRAWSHQLGYHPSLCQGLVLLFAKFEPSFLASIVVLLNKSWGRLGNPPNSWMSDPGSTKLGSPAQISNLCLISFLLSRNLATSIGCSFKFVILQSCGWRLANGSKWNLKAILHLTAGTNIAVLSPWGLDRWVKKVNSVTMLAVHLHRMSSSLK